MTDRVWGKKGCDFVRHLQSVVGPTREFHRASLFVEGEELDVDAAR